MKNFLLTPNFYQNRERFIKRMKKNSIAIFISNDEMPMNGDAIYRFKQNTDLYWLSGVTQEDSMVIFFPITLIQNTGKCWFWFGPMN